MRLESARNLFALTYFASVVSVVGSLGDLPERVASSFGGGGAAQAFMTRTMYGALFTSFSVIVPLGLVAAFVWLPRRFSGFVNVPMREAWLAPEFRVELFRRLGLAGYLTGGSAALFFAAMHALLVEALRELRLDRGRVDAPRWRALPPKAARIHSRAAFRFRRSPSRARSCSPRARCASPTTPAPGMIFRSKTSKRSEPMSRNT